MTKKQEIDSTESNALHANFSALLYVASEQQAMIGLLLKALVNNNLISIQQLEEITDIHGNEELLTPVYENIYKTFAEYFLQSKTILEAAERRDDDGE